MASPFEILIDIGRERLESVAKTIGNSSLQGVFKDELKDDDDPTKGMEPSHLERLRKYFIRQYMKEQEFSRQTEDPGLRSKIDTELSKPLPSAVEGYLNTATS